MRVRITELGEQLGIVSADSTGLKIEGARNEDGLREMLESIMRRRQLTAQELVAMLPDYLTGRVMANEINDQT